MFKRLAVWLFAACALASGAPAFAQMSTAQQVLPGFLTTVSCPGSAYTCYVSGVPALATSAAASSLVLKAAAGNLYNIEVTAGASAGFLMIFNATSAPADGTVSPTFCYPVAASANFSTSFPPASFSTGITAVFSTTGCFTKTASATAFISGGAL